MNECLENGYLREYDGDVEENYWWCQKKLLDNAKEIADFGIEESRWCFQENENSVRNWWWWFWGKLFYDVEKDKWIVQENKYDIECYWIMLMRIIWWYCWRRKVNAVEEAVDTNAKLR